jgi:hypothetical protein
MVNAYGYALVKSLDNVSQLAHCFALGLMMGEGHLHY